MQQLFQFKVVQIASGKSVIIRCVIILSDSLIQKITFYTTRNLLKHFNLRSKSPLISALSLSGEYHSTLRAKQNDNEEKLFELLTNEFGSKFLIKTDFPAHNIRGEKFKPTFIRRSPKKKAAKKRSWGGGHRKGASKKRIKKRRFESQWLHADGQQGSFVEGRISNVGLSGLTTKKLQKKYPKKQDCHTVDVFYTTDREKTDSQLIESQYGNKPSVANKLRFGICKVSIPHSHKVGNIERPSWWRNLVLFNPENPKKHITIYELNEKTKADFLKLLGNKINGSPDKDAFIFIHGFSVKFADAIRRTAQIAHDLSYEGAAITYSWPSNDRLSKKGYMTDEQTIEWTIPHLQKFIVSILKTLKIEKLHLIGHSMGTRALTKAVAALKVSNPELLPKLNQIILAAPDIDGKIFVDTIVPGIKSSAKQVTLYASSKDKALMLSNKYRDAVLRAGQSGKNIIIIKGVETIDASSVDTNFIGHGYFAETKDLINDIYHILKHSFTPPQRNLKSVSVPKRGKYWRFPLAKGVTIQYLN